MTALPCCNVGPDERVVNIWWNCDVAQLHVLLDFTGNRREGRCRCQRTRTILHQKDWAQATYFAVNKSPSSQRLSMTIWNVVWNEGFEHLWYDFKQELDTWQSIFMRLSWVRGWGSKTPADLVWRQPISFYGNQLFLYRELFLVFEQTQQTRIVMIQRQFASCKIKTVTVPFTHYYQLIFLCRVVIVTKQHIPNWRRMSQIWSNIAVLLAESVLGILKPQHLSSRTTLQLPIKFAVNRALVILWTARNPRATAKQVGERTNEPQKEEPILTMFFQDVDHGLNVFFLHALPARPVLLQHEHLLMKTFFGVKTFFAESHKSTQKGQVVHSNCMFSLYVRQFSRSTELTSGDPANDWQPDTHNEKIRDSREITEV